MSGTFDQRHKSILDWIVPALLALITALMVLGGTNMLDSMHDTRNEMTNLRKDVQESALQTEKRLTRLEDMADTGNEMMTEGLRLSKKQDKKFFPPPPRR